MGKNVLIIFSFFLVTSWFINCSDFEAIRNKGSVNFGSQDMSDCSDPKNKSIHCSSVDNQAPSVVLVNPTSNSTYGLPKIEKIIADATDNVGIVKVEFYKNGSLVLSTGQTPYEYQYDISASENGNHSFYARAYDAAGNMALSTPVNITVNVSSTKAAHAWVINSTFEDGVIGQVADNKSGATTGASYTWPLSQGGRTLFANDNAHSGMQSAKATLSKGHSGWGEWGLFYTYPKLYEGMEIWLRTWINFPSNFQWPASQGVKGLKLIVRKGDDSNHQAFSFYPKQNYIHVENWIDLKSFYVNNTRASMENHDKQTSGWQAWEMYVKFSAMPGQGIFRVWRDGKLWFEDTNTKTLFDSSSYSDSIHILGLYEEVGSPIEQSVWIDDVIITNDRPSKSDVYGNPFIGM